mmetsp:Transcript_6001/g.18955  ORF Transcript_6001/g.18955 Transcript_6001/m.18955 type:complete len:343 (-) Transcript_6001:196-1224(-)
MSGVLCNYVAIGHALDDFVDLGPPTCLSAELRDFLEVILEFAKNHKELRKHWSVRFARVPGQSCSEMKRRFVNDVEQVLRPFAIKKVRPYTRAWSCLNRAVDRIAATPQAELSPEGDWNTAEKCDAINAEVARAVDAFVFSCRALDMKNAVTSFVFRFHTKVQRSEDPPFRLVNFARALHFIGQQINERWTENLDAVVNYAQRDVKSRVWASESNSDSGVNIVLQATQLAQLCNTLHRLVCRVVVATLRGTVKALSMRISDDGDGLVEENKLISSNREQIIRRLVEWVREAGDELCALESAPSELSSSGDEEDHTLGGPTTAGHSVDPQDLLTMLECDSSPK